MGDDKEKLTMYTFFVSTDRRDKTRYPNASNFVYDLPLTLNNVTAFAVRDHKFKRETLVNANNNMLRINENGVSKTVTIAKGDYNNDVTTLMSAVNSALASANVPVGFSVQSVDGVDRVVLGFTGSPPANYFVVIDASSLLRIFGYEGGTGICLLRGSVTGPTLDTNILRFANTAAAPFAYDTWTFADMVLRITDIETILSPDMVTNRCSAILFNTNSEGSMCKQSLDHKIPLLQVQHRLQRLQIRMLNMEGDLYDNSNYEAQFLLEFYCKTPAA